MAEIQVDVTLPSATSVDVTSPTQALAANVIIPGPQGPRGLPLSLNNITSDYITITGQDGNYVYTGLNTIYISGNSGYFQSAINTLTTNLNLTGTNLNTKIDAFSGTYQNFVDNLDATYATDSQLQQTGSSLVNSINSLSGTLTSTYATITNLALTGSTLQTQINDLGNTYATDTELTNVQTNLNNKITSLSGDAVLLKGDQIIQGQKTFTGSNVLIDKELYVYGSGYFPSGIKIGTDSVIINGNTVLVNNDPVALTSELSQTGTTIYNTIGSLSGSSILAYGEQTIEGIKNFSGTNVAVNILSGASLTVSGNPVLTGVDLSPYATNSNLALTGSTLQNQINNLDLTYATDIALASTGSTLVESINNLTINIGNQYATITNLALTGATLQTQINNLDNTYATDTNLNLTGQTLDQKINTFSGTYQNFVDNIDLTYATDIQLQNTGSSLINNINSLSGTLTSNYATIVNLASTGSSLQNQINNLNDTYATDIQLQNTGTTLVNSINSLSGTLTSEYATIINLASTGSTLATNLSLTGATLQNQIDNLDLTYATDIALASTGNTLQTQINNLGTTYATVTNLALTGSTLENKIGSLSGTLTSDYATIVNLASTGTTLQNYINSLSGSSVLLYGDQTIDGTKTFRDKVYIHDLYVTGEEFIANVTNNFIESPYILLNLTGGATDGGIFFVTGSGLTGINDLGPIIGFDHTDKFKFGISSRGSDLSTLNDIAAFQDITAYSGFVDNKYATIINLASTGSTLQNQIDNLGNTYATVTNLALTGSTLEIKIGSLSGTLTSTYATITNLASTGSTLESKIASLSGSAVLLYGNQTISGDKTYTQNINVSGTGTFNAVDLNNIDQLSLSGIDISVTSSTVNVYGNILISGNPVLTGIPDANWASQAEIDSLSGYSDNTFATITNLASTGSTLASNLTNTGSNLQTQINNLGNTYATVINLASTGSTLEGKIGSLSGMLTSTYATITNLASTGSTLNTKIDNLSGYINSSSSNIVFTTGDQTINGLKTFTSGIDIYSGTNPQSIRVFNSTGTNSGEFALLGWQNNELVIGSQATNSGILRPLIITGENISYSGKRLTIAHTNAGLFFDATGPTIRGNHWGAGDAGFITYRNGLDMGRGGSKYLRVDSSSPTVIVGRGSSSYEVGVGFDGTNSNLSSPDVFILRDQANILAQRNGINAQQFRVYNITGTNTGEFGLVGWVNSGFVVGPQQTNLGALRDLTLTGANININASGAFNIFDNTNILGDLNVTGNILLSGNPVLTGSSTLYATSANLASTGSTLNTKIDTLSGAAVLIYGNQTIGGDKTFTGVTTFSGQEVNLVDTALNLSGVGDMTFSGTNINFINSPVYVSGTNLRVDGNILLSGNSVLTGVDLSNYVTKSLAIAYAIAL